MAKHDIPSIPHSPYSPDFAACDFFLFPQLKKTMKGRRFDYVGKTVTTKEFLAKHKIPSLAHPPNSPDLAPCDSFLFPQLKKTMKGRRFDYVEEIQANVMRHLRAVTKSDYQGCFCQ